MQPTTRLTATAISAAVTTAAVTAALLPTAATAAAAGRPHPSRATAVAGADAAVAAHARALGVTAAQGRTVRDVVVDADGAQHVRYDRTYRGLPVLGGDLVVHLAPGGAYAGADRAARSDLAVPTTTPAVAPSRAADGAVASLRAAERGRALRQAKARPELVVDALHGAPRLAWRTTAVGLDSLGNPAARVVLTDARTGARIDAWDALETAAGDGASLYSGTVPLETTLSGSSYQLKDATRGNTYTGDAAGKTDSCFFGICFSRAPATVFTDADNHWGTGTTADRASAAVDAQYGTDETWDYYKNVHGRSGIAGDGKGSYNRVHYGSAYNNAFWDDSCFCMTYGDGDGTTFGPLVALDVAGHEMSHGVTSRTAKLTYSGESGGLNEATSDIFGTLVEWYAANSSDSGDYLIGERIVKSGFGKAALRFMDKPSKDGKSADCWSSGVGNLDVHYSSGVANHFAYLLAEGSGAKTVNGVAYDSPTCNGSTVTGIGRDRLGKIWYRALTVYMTSSTNYAGARTASLKAATDLYGAGSAEYNAVAAAWSAVGVN
ncbi:M4 family metallopeptidase [Streptacidiphilus sp. ASG 303]|uniref:M4 family metallopeptidase n=1 Tax=Streptacidiphilus sp. ASG 303 TaxID=2896847 RepID=UPI001E5D5796|nr:M4 family metallopeptidase [Streptacidiphilus sp. ASG 303]MCD0482547.1 M4 family metallopeptidase [Streptacidiphilus sp. ASG 303]